MSNSAPDPTPPRDLLFCTVAFQQNRLPLCSPVTVDVQLGGMRDAVQFAVHMDFFSTFIWRAVREIVGVQFFFSDIFGVQVNVWLYAF